MRRNQILGYSIVGLFAAMVIGQDVASAQDPGATPSQPASVKAKGVQLSPADQQVQSDSFVARMESIRDGIRVELEDARQKRDVVKTLCLNDKLNQIDVALRSAKERQTSLKLAAQRGDQDLATHEFTILTVIHDRTQQLDAEAKQCIGKEVGFVGESSVTVDIDPGLPEEDPTEYPTPPIISEPPMSASAVR
jgi:hypothetical protein